MTQTERIEEQLPGDALTAVDPLPAGSSFDAAAGIFRWQPAPGFFGAYDLSFILAAGSSGEPVKLRVIIGPSIRVAIDAPAEGSELPADGFTIGGWAADLGSVRGSGIDTLHVWAYVAAGTEPVGEQRESGVAQKPVFVGVARPGGARRRQVI